MNHSCSFAGMWEVLWESWHLQQLHPTRVCATHWPGMMKRLGFILAQVWIQTFHLVSAELEVTFGTEVKICIFLIIAAFVLQLFSGFACPNCIFNWMFHCFRCDVTEGLGVKWTACHCVPASLECDWRFCTVYSFKQLLFGIQTKKQTSIYPTNLNI